MTWIKSPQSLHIHLEMKRYQKLSTYEYIQACYDILSQIEILGSFLITLLNPSFETCIAWFASISIASLQ
jgi:hypothetical protein